MNDIEIEITAVESVSMALVQNSVPVIQYIEIINNSETDIENHQLKISSDPIEAFNAVIPIDLIRSGETLFLDKPKLKQSWDFYNSISENLSGSLNCTLVKDDEIVVETSKEITFHTQNTWLGQTTQVELICSHIQPSSDGVQIILKDVDLKAGEFKPEYAGKMNFYCNVVNDHLRKEGDKPTIGMI